MAESDNSGNKKLKQWTFEQLDKDKDAKKLCIKLGNRFKEGLTATPNHFTDANIQVSCGEFGDLKTRDFGLELFDILGQKRNSRLYFGGLVDSASEGLTTGKSYLLLETPRVYEDGSCYLHIDSEKGARFAPFYAFKSIGHQKALVDPDPKPIQLEEKATS